VKRVLFLTYHFPPIGGAGSQRPARMVRHLLERGYESVVVTAPGTTSSRWMPADETIDVPAAVEVHRVPGPEPRPSGGWRARAERWLGLPAPWTRWWRRGLVATGLAAGRDVDLVYCWMQPYESAAAATALARKLRVPLVTDLGDPWALDEMMVFPTGVHRRIALRSMRRHLRAASAVVMSTPEAARQVRRQFPELADRPVVAIPNGFERSDFTQPMRARRDGKFRIVHTGYLYAELGERHRRTLRLRRIVGGEPQPVDILTRSHVFLLEAVERLLEANPRLREVVEVHLAGVASEADRRVAERSSAVRLHGFLSHERTLELMRDADLLFLPMHDLHEGGRARVVPGKTYEYLAAGRPILAAVPDGDARDLLAESGAAALCRPADVDAVEAALRESLRRFERGEPVPAPRPEVIERFEYRRLASALADVFDRVAAAEGGAEPVSVSAGAAFTTSRS
jgi:glycosyltransferase involved in cell wall biosynthesis